MITNWSRQDRDHMAAALGLAREQLGRTAPNPSVGCVLVKDEAVLAVAATGAGGRPHAEEAALATAGEAARAATAYVTLEPCAQRSSGVASCSERFVQADVARVVIACADPHPNAAGRGVDLMRAAGLLVEEGLAEAEALALNAGFFHRVETGRPLVSASADGVGFDARFEPREDGDLKLALEKLGAEGLTRLWVPTDSGLADTLRAAGLLRERL